ncbi:putative major facilitator superfamily, MFS transporter superfamily [Dioscorea sansibarensis]
MGQGGSLTLVLVNLAGIMERADEALLPAVYEEIGSALHATPTGLGSLTLFRSIVQSACYPLATYMSARYNRAHVIALGAFLWAAATFLVGLSSTFLEVAISRGLNGVGLALVGPAIQSLIADSTEDHNRGTAFGWLQLTGSLGSIFGGLFSLLLAPTSFMGIDGWRLAFHLVGMISVIVGILVRLFAVDPHYMNRDIIHADQMPRKSIKAEVIDLFKEAKGVIKIPSFQIIVAQGVTGSFPWSALAFAPMWLELIGFSHVKTGFLMSMFVVAVSLGGLFGGKMGDFLAKRFPNSGRIFLSQISSGSAVPLAAILLLFLPDDPSSWFSHALVLFIMGLSISWNAPATNNPIFAEIVPEKARTNIYALDRTFESVLASFAPPTVGILAEHMYGFKPIAYGQGKNTMVQVDKENAAALAKALFTAIAIPISLCCVIYSFLYRTYPRDRERARMNALVNLEMQHIELEGSLALQDKHIHGKDGGVIDLVYADEDFDIDDNDKRQLLPEQNGLSNGEQYR